MGQEGSVWQLSAAHAVMKLFVHLLACETFAFQQELQQEGVLQHMTGSVVSSASSPHPKQPQAPLLSRYAQVNWAQKAATSPPLN